MTEKSDSTLCKQVMWLPKKEKFDGLHKCLKNAFGRVFPKKEIPF